MNTITLKLSKALNAKLDATAKRRGASKSAIVREAIEKYFARHVTPSLSVDEIAKDLRGCVNAGPRDLS
jgi:predicted transcriptional regulator